MAFAYLDSNDNVLAVGTTDVELSAVQNKNPSAVTKISGAPDTLRPVPAEDDFRNVQHHRKTSGDGTDISHYTLVESLGPYKRQRYQEIDQRTRELIESGFLFDGTIFSLSSQAQDNWLRLRLDIVAGVLTSANFPYSISTIDDGQYFLQGLTDAARFYSAYSNTVDDRLQSGRDLKDQIRQASTKSEIDAIVDDRQDTALPEENFTTATKRQESLTGTYRDWYFEVTHEQGNKVTKVDRYAFDNGDGTYDDLVQDVVYNYQGSKLVSIVTTTYDDQGQMTQQETESFFSDKKAKTTVRKFS